MKYKRIQEGRFFKRPNRFIAHIEIEGKEEIVHVKNTGRCAELLVPGCTVYVQRAEQENRKTKWDLIGVKKSDRLINMDSQIPNKVVQEWLEAGGLFEKVSLIRPETTYRNSRFDLYVEHEGKKAFIEVKGVTLEEDGKVLFPDAPSERAVRHLEELSLAVKDGYEAYVIFVIQMKQVRYFTPNRQTHPQFAEALLKAKEEGVHVLAYDCHVSTDSIKLADPVPVVLEDPLLYETVEPLTKWYRENCRNLPWREHVNAYRVWVSEIMLQQTRVEAVKRYFARFMEALPTVEALAKEEEDRLLKLWEGLGYYNRVRNMQKAAVKIMEEYGGEFPETYEEIRKLPGIGNYTAGAISSFAFGIPKPAVDGNVLRVLARLKADRDDIMKASVRTRMERELEPVIPADHASDYNQGLIELGAMVCVPNGEPKCEICPLKELCRAKKLGIWQELPVRKKAKARKVEERTILILRDGEEVAIQKRPSRGLLAGMYEFPNKEGTLSIEEIAGYCREIGLEPLRIREAGKAKHIFSHVEWHMTGYEVRVDELAAKCSERMIFAHPDEIEAVYSIPSAFDAYTRQLKK